MSPAAETAGVQAAPSAPARPVLINAYLAAGAATFFWSSNVVAVKYILRDIPPFQAGLLRITFAALALGCVWLAQRRPIAVRPADRRALLWLAVSGVGWSFLLFTAALSFTSVAHAVFIGALTPIGVLSVARMKGQENITLMKLTGLLICLLGVTLLVFDKTYGSGSGWLGDLMAFGGMGCFVYFTVGSKRLAVHYDSLSLVTVAFLAAALFALPFTFWAISTISWGQIHGVTWLALAYSATFGSAGAYLSYYYSLRTLAPSQAAAFQYVQPVLATCFGVVFLAETWGTGFAIGAALILLGMLLAERR